MRFLDYRKFFGREADKLRLSAKEQGFYFKEGSFMNGELQILNTPIFLAKTKMEKVEIKEVKISESRNLKIRNHFDRLKKNLRRRSRNIL